MAQSFDLVDAALHGTLETQLRQLEADGLSQEAIAGVFAAKGFDVGRETVRRWFQRIGGSRSRAGVRKGTPT